MLVPDCISSKLDKSTVKLCSSLDDVFIALIIIDEFENGKHKHLTDEQMVSHPHKELIKETISFCEKHESCIPCVKTELYNKELDDLRHPEVIYNVNNDRMWYFPRRSDVIMKFVDIPEDAKYICFMQDIGTVDKTKVIWDKWYCTGFTQLYTCSVDNIPYINLCGPYITHIQFLDDSKNIIKTDSKYKPKYIGAFLNEEDRALLISSE